ncbi:glycosyl hydrolase 108 family protein [Pseudomaricurvus sp. HS19]|uniref:glycosyl hydrolase 108 family protein n=1 Tax=Pseudomaricurvus sp. HS19 TaxID=2692626 RepID=UPI0013711B61|nr:glycosyl hydrolase 108 family protein [Pseudomaricurvus sp. HS19]MYM63107.1 hypothetical protein [Pseudomaricurvus sp. HS19]
MKDNFVSSLQHVLAHEGGWSDHPEDPGGATMKGVTLATYRRVMNKPKASKNDLKAISDEELQRIYSKEYWHKCHCDELPNGVDYVVFDAAVNSGPGRSAGWLQLTVGATKDGHIGPKTLEKTRRKNIGLVIDELCDLRLKFLQSLSTWGTFGRGWERRVEGVRSHGFELANLGMDGVAGISPDVDYEVVKAGSKGEWVSKVQKVLKIRVDGVFGNKTKQALLDWQKNNGLVADGIAGRSTYRAMGLIF